jgi:NADPH:quinone reductase-like Zn-dependent oxidoreductase
LGAKTVFDYRDKKLCEKIRHELGPQGFDAVLDSIGDDVTVRNIELMRFCGRIACLKPLPTFGKSCCLERHLTLVLYRLLVLG